MTVPNMTMLRLVLVILATTACPVLSLAQDIVFSPSSDDDEDYEPFDLDDVKARVQGIQRFDEPMGNGDVNGDGEIDVLDSIYTLKWVFGLGPGPVPMSCLSAVESVDPPLPFSRISMHLEVDESNGDVEVMLSAKTDDGIRSFTVYDPLDRKLADAQFLNGQELGLEEVQLQTVDSSLDGVKGVYPEGSYLFQAITTSGAHIAGTTSLTYDLAPAPRFAHVVRPDNLLVQWLSVENAAGYILEIEQEDVGFELLLELGPDRETFAIPRELLVEGVEYELTLGTISESGNRSLVETKFTIPIFSARAEK